MPRGGTGEPVEDRGGSMSQWEPAEAEPEREPRAVAGTDEAHKSRLAGDGADGPAQAGARSAATESRPPAYDRALETADGQVVACGTRAESDAVDTLDAPEDRKPQAPLWTTWCTVLSGCCLLLAVILGGTSFTYARWEHPGAGTVAAYAVGDLLAVSVVVFVSLMVLGTLVERYELSTLGETSLVLAILLVVPVLGVGLWHPQAFGHMGMWGRSLARSLV
jgi:hypothetical protein